jgi:LysM repeat protein
MRKALLITLFVLAVVWLWAVPAFAQGGHIHYVQWGENLASIASRYNVSAQAIMSANGLDDPDFVYVGQKLVIPPVRSGFGVGSSGYYTVQPGDTLNKIAQRLNTSVQALATANNLTDADTIYVGQVLNVPGSQWGKPGHAPAYRCGYYYPVEWGDSLSSIAWQHGITIQALMQANTLSDEVIYQGQKLCVPGRYTRPPMTGYYYTVKSGDTVSSIAAHYGVPQKAIIQANNLSHTGLIYVGQKLLIPGHKPGPSSTKSDAPEYQPPGPPEYVEVTPTGDIPVTVVKAVDKWWGRQTADVVDPNGLTSMVVRTTGMQNIPVVVEREGFAVRGVTGDAPNFGIYDYGFESIPPGIYDVWVDQGKSETVTVELAQGRRTFVEFSFTSASEDLPARSLTGWSGQVVKNTSGTTDASGVWSVIIVRASAVGLPISIRSEGNDYQAMCYTGTKPEYGPAACDFGGLWPGRYTVTLEGAGVAVEVFMDGVGVAEIVFDNG